MHAPDEPRHDGLPAPRRTWRIPDARRLPALEPYADDVLRVPVVSVRETVWDSEDGVLAAAGVEVLRAEDGTWTIDRGAGPQVVDGAGAGAGADGLRDQVEVFLRGRPLAVVRVRDTVTTLLVLHGKDGRRRAEVADVRVDEGSPDSAVLRSGRWWALTDDGSTGSLVRGVERALDDAASDAPADDHPAGPVPRLAPVRRPGRPHRPRSGTSARFVVDVLAGLRADVVEADPYARADAPEAVHDLRKVLRRLRSVLAAYRGALDRAATESLRRRLSVIGRAAGRVRDAEVLAAGLTPTAERAPTGLVEDGALGALRDRFLDERRARLADLQDALRSPEWFAALDALDALIAAAPPGPRADDPVRGFVERRLHHERRRVRRARDRAASRDDLATLHEARKAARRLRYAVEAAGGFAASHQHLGRLRRVQEVLGAGLDAAHAAEALRDESGFTAGVLATVDQQRSDRRVRRGRELLARI
ncbi:CHAD domain-containing protein [Curtobacterium sp. MCBD17_021]|uniref:CHAD domain-containing protein n=1 Tax=Curtobacterium sp. MCBD17_021 TaxID=2175665 RepID=UPI000DA7BA0E|nr:CHAD domain-containing protein [Curtobacterium sp. MCBD17_021]PZE69495.1 hypothetical protein DEI83_00090 [Curtobacterium sp. MCBD17_021]